MVTIRPVDFYHLGDMVNVLQANKQADYIYIDKQCKCCKNDLKITVKTLLGFMTKLKLTDAPIGKLIDVKPYYAQSLQKGWQDAGTYLWHRTPYEKTKHTYEKENYIACQFDFRSNPPWPKGIDEDQIAKLCMLGDLVNIGDKPRPNMTNRTDASLFDKIEIIGKAKAYIGIDSGLTHVALTMDIPTYVVHKKGYCPWFFYPEGPMFINDVDLFFSISL